MAEVTVIESKIANLGSLVRAFETIGVTVEVSKDPRVICKARRLVLPGVGAFAAGMDELKKNELNFVLGDVVAKGTPLLGICLGMQLLLDSSEENGVTRGLGLIQGKVIKIPSVNTFGVRERKVPHIGWSAIFPSSKKQGWECSSFSTTDSGDFFYFVHSYRVSLANPKDSSAECDYSGVAITAALSKNNITGLQFHPERSGPKGLEILRAFARSDTID